MAKSATVIPFPTTTRAKNVYRRRAYKIRAEEAFKAGFMMLSRPERELIELLRWTNFTGRDAVMSVAREMRRAQPWRDGVDGVSK